MRTFFRITFPLALVNFLNQASRAVMAVIGPLLALEFGLSASDLGLLAAVLFAAYGLAQLPVGLALDIFGARRVQTVLSLTAGLGFLICALAEDVLFLGVGRFVTGIGIAAGLMAMLKANTQWFPRAKVAAMTGSGVFVGALGGMVATLPMQALIPLTGWRGGFLIFAVLSCLIAAWIWISVADAPPGYVRPPRRSLVAEITAFGPIFAHPYFRRFVPAILMLTTMNFVYQGLWAGPWLRDVAGLDDQARGLLLFTYACGAAAGSLLTGQAASFLQGRGHSPMLVPSVAMGALLAIQAVLIVAPPSGMPALGLVWLCFAMAASAGPAGYAAVGQRFGPELAGRVATAINGSMLVLVFLAQIAIGAILDLWPRTAEGGWNAAGYGWAMGLTLGLQALVVLWAWRGRRLLGATAT
ncbi:MFS transporter [Roseococcus sp. SYP-B2431]|uniref:MFS transporter n=1 Tax=Roseococcus sp. SYP-B2431 TaxID=2496640 RepID=UPI0013F41778|nr:MFS transporter [Roseococcus sp. SYP-B2431]